MAQINSILIVDDEPDIVEFLSYNIRSAGFNVFSANNGHDAIKIAEEKIPDMIILDVTMPGMDGVETCVKLKQINKLKNTLIMFLTARAEDYSQITGLDAGADDYVAKPIKPKVLISRINALLRRSPIQNETGKETIKIENLIIDRNRYMVTFESQQIELPRKEFELLYLLASKPDKVFTREEIFEKIWDDNVIVGERTIDVHIRKIREKIDIPNIKTVKGIGYKFESSH
jgi:two-component system alkaline phosphatase synthesis response regulator PhoP